MKRLLALILALALLMSGATWAEQDDLPASEETQEIASTPEAEPAEELSSTERPEATEEPAATETPEPTRAAGGDGGTCRDGSPRRDRNP